MNLSSLTLKLLQTSMCLFVLLYTKEDIWKNVLIKQISIIDYHSMYFFLLWKSVGIEICLIKTFFQISGLEQLEGE